MTPAAGSESRQQDRFFARMLEYREWAVVSGATTGDFNLSDSDANVGGMGVDRSFDSFRQGADSLGVFGPGWSSTLDLGTYVKLHFGTDASQGDFVTIYGGDNTEIAFSLDNSGDYTPGPGWNGNSLTTSGSGSSRTWTLTDLSGVATTFAIPSGGSSLSGDYYPTSVTAPNDATNPQTTSLHTRSSPSPAGRRRDRPRK